MEGILSLEKPSGEGLQYDKPSASSATSAKLPEISSGRSGRKRASSLGGRHTRWRLSGARSSETYPAQDSTRASPDLPCLPSVQSGRNVPTWPGGPPIPLLGSPGLFVPAARMARSVYRRAP